MQFIFQRSTDISHRKISKVESLHPGPKVSPSFKPSLQEYKNNSFLAILASDSNLLGLLSPTFQANPKFKHGFTVQTLLFVGGGPIFYHFLYDLDERWSSNWELQPEQVGIAWLTPAQPQPAEYSQLARMALGSEASGKVCIPQGFAKEENFPPFDGLLLRLSIDCWMDDWLLHDIASACRTSS